MALHSLASLATPANIVSAIIILNLWTFMLFGIDKMKAEAGSWRVSEASLLFWAFIGGSIGAYAGRAIFRHKTRKQPFSGQLHGVAIFQLFAGALGAGWMLA
jgi:uncharacterized membrane protein YsdA (DUF1294 family)